MAKEEREIADLVTEHHGHFPGSTAIQKGLYTIEHGGIYNAYVQTNEMTREEFNNPNGIHINFANYGNLKAANAEFVDVDTSYRVDVELYTDLETRNEYLEYAKSESGSKGLGTMYFFDENGKYGKIQRTGNNFRVNKPILWDTSRGPAWGTVAFLSEMTPEDFELAGRALGLIKEKLLTALGRTPPQAPDQGLNTPNQ